MCRLGGGGHLNCEAIYPRIFTKKCITKVPQVDDDDSR